MNEEKNLTPEQELVRELLNNMKVLINKGYGIKPIVLSILDSYEGDILDYEDIHNKFMDYLKDSKDDIFFNFGRFQNLYSFLAVKLDNPEVEMKDLELIRELIRLRGLGDENNDIEKSNIMKSIIGISVKQVGVKEAGSYITNFEEGLIAAAGKLAKCEVKLDKNEKTIKIPCINDYKFTSELKFEIGN
jgi:hypothetical protein